MTTKQFEIYFSDLSEDKQKEYIDRFGDDDNIDISPLSIIDIEVDEEEN